MSKNLSQPDPMEEWRYLLENTLLAKKQYVNFGDQPGNLTDALYHLSWSLRELARAITVAKTPSKAKKAKKAKGKKGDQDFYQPARSFPKESPETFDAIDFS